MKIFPRTDIISWTKRFLAQLVRDTDILQQHLAGTLCINQTGKSLNDGIRIPFSLRYQVINVITLITVLHSCNHWQIRKFSNKTILF